MSAGEPPPPRAGLADALGRRLLILIPYGWLVVLFLVPFAIVLKISLSQPTIAIPPYLPLWQLVDDAGDRIARLSLDLSSYLRLFADSLYVRAYLNSLRLAAIGTALALLVGLPVAYAWPRHRSAGAACCWRW